MPINIKNYEAGGYIKYSIVILENSFEKLNKNRHEFSQPPFKHFLVKR